jgi:PAS domain S-box-containing protein
MDGTKKHIDKQPIPGDIILKSMPGLAYVFNEEQRLIMWNKNLELTTEYSEEELLNKHMDDFIEEESRELNAEAFDKVLSEKTELSIEYHLVTKSGKKIPIIDSGCYAEINGKNYIIGQAIDITRLKETEKKLQLAMAELQALKDRLQAENIYLREEIKHQHDFYDITHDGDGTGGHHCSGAPSPHKGDGDHGHGDDSYLLAAKHG